MVSQSDTVAKVTAALVTAQGAFPTVEKNSTNPHFKAQYADLTAIVETVRPHLAKAGLAVIQFPDELQGEPALTTRLVHSSGEYLQATTPLALAPRGAKPNAQEVGSAMTYARRYGMQAVLGLVAEDDDGNAASRTDSRPRAASEGPRDPGGTRSGGEAVRSGTTDDASVRNPSPPGPTISEPQAKRLWTVARSNKIPDAVVRSVITTVAGVDHTKDIPRDLYDAVMGALGEKAAA